MRRALGAGLFAVALALPAPGSAQSAFDFESRREVRRLEIEGNTAFSDRTLRGLLRTRSSSFLKPWRDSPYRRDFIRFDAATLQAYYHRKGYLGASVESVRVDSIPGNPRKVDVTFRIREGPLSRLTGIRLEGTQPLSEVELRRVLKQKPGNPVDIPLIEADRLAIEERYADLGHITAQVRDSLLLEDGRATVLYRIEPDGIARLGNISVSGNQTTRGRVVSREITLRPGDVLSRSKLVESQQRIYDTGLYSDVLFERGPIDSLTRLSDLLITVRERKMAWIDAGLGYGTSNQLRVTSEWGHRNLGREGLRFVAAGRIGLRLWEHVFEPDLGDRRADVSLSEPWIFGTRTRASLGGYAEQIPKIQERIDFALRAYGVTLGLQRDLARRTHGLLSLEYRHVISDTVALETEVGVGQQSYSTRRVRILVERDTRRDLFDPKSGSDLLGNVEVAGGLFRGSTRFRKYSGSASAYRPLGRDLTLAVRIRAGYVHPYGSRPAAAEALPDLNLIPVDDRFRTGGATSVRGYFENEIGVRVRLDSLGVEQGEVRGGEVLLLGSVEARFPLFWILGGAAFLDGGNVWERPGDLSLQRLFTLAGGGAGYLDMRYSAGVGLRIGTPVGPVRFDYGWKLRHARREEHDLSSTRGTFHFSLGQAF
ncbi:MAG: BamA/TamA family outer membrane protein [Candidatus Latescibacteria bacterium]|nr:BamA/TamA family outer membrane protein [Candidatus Latescibacterota bacterium]